jgi:hypothetical protein
MTLWILTIGNSDILLNTDSNWQTLRRKTGNSNLNVFKPVLERNRKSYSVPARSLGLVYGGQPESADLSFARIDTLCQKFGQSPPPDQLIILLTDQSALFENVRNEHSPYWQDTCELRSLLTFYFERKFPGAIQHYWTIQPAPDQPGLDHWEKTLSLVQSLFHHNASMLVADEQQVYLSHQAGTPALSAAIQFVCLTYFGSRVHFLLSNEYQALSYESIESVVYLKGLRKQEAKALLKQYDYAGVKRLFSSYLDPFSNNLLDALILWNYAGFGQFVSKLQERLRPEFENTLEIDLKRSTEYWWASYESAYLAVVRLRQGNTVEAMFHSFRAVEGLLAKWFDKYHSSLMNKKERKIILPREITFPNGNKSKKMNPYGVGLYYTLEVMREVDRTRDSDIWIFGNHVFKARNSLFHQINGLQSKEAVFQAWETADEQAWKDRVCACLNFISERSDLESLEQASLMAKVHAELERAIDSSPL